MAYGEVAYGEGPYGGGLAENIAVGLAALTPAELQSLAQESARAAVAGDLRRAVELVESIAVSAGSLNPESQALLDRLGSDATQPTWRTRVDDANAIFELLRNVVVVLVLLVGGTAFTADEIKKVLERNAYQFQQSPATEDQEAQLEGPGEDQ